MLLTEQEGIVFSYTAFFCIWVKTDWCKMYIISNCIYNSNILTYIKRIINEYSEYIFAIFLTVYEAAKCRYIYILYCIGSAVET